VGFLRFVQRLAVLFFFVGVCIETTSAQQWEYLGLPGEAFTSIAVQSRDTLYASTLGSIFKTTNGGVIWGTLLQHTYVFDLKIHPVNPEIIYAALGNINPPYGVLKSTNGGTTWFHADSGIFANWETSAQVIEFDPIFPETMYVGTAGFFGGNLYKSTNGGQSWIALEAVSDTGRLRQGVISIAVNPESTNIIYAGTSQNVDLFKSTDGGSTWFLLRSQGGGVDIKIDQTNPQLLYVCSLAVHKSTDGGISWVVSDSGLPSQSNTGRLAINQMTRTVYVVLYAISSDSGGVFESNNLGLSWDRMPGLFLTNNIRTLTLSPEHDQIYVGVDNSGIYRGDLITGIASEGKPIPLSPSLFQNYPNPFNPTTVIRYELPKQVMVSLKVYNLLGQEAASLVSEVQIAGKHQAVLRGENLSSGVYFYRLQAGEFVETKKLVLLK
jgi:hypothetical protein